MVYALVSEQYRLRPLLLCILVMGRQALAKAEFLS